MSFSQSTRTIAPMHSMLRRTALRNRHRRTTKGLPLLCRSRSLRMRYLLLLIICVGFSTVYLYAANIVAEDEVLPKLSISYATDRVERDKVAGNSIQSPAVTQHLERKPRPTSSLPPYLCMQPVTEIFIEARLFNTTHMSQDLCREFCLESLTLYAAITDGSKCQCLNIYGSDLLSAYDACNLPCPGNKEQTCGGQAHAQVEKIDSRDMVHGWSPWTSYSRHVRMNRFTLRTRVQMIDCLDFDQDQSNRCKMKVQVTVAPKLKASVKPLLVTAREHLIGCFTEHSFQSVQSIPGNITQFGNSIHIDLGSLSIQTEECLTHCKKAELLYAVLMRNSCLCTDSMGWSQPVDVCMHGIGALVFSTQPLSQGISLKYEPRRTLQKVTVTAHYRGGSTLTSSLLEWYPGAMHIFEPGSVFGLIWTSNGSQATAVQHGEIFTEKVYPHWFNCDPDKLPGAFVRRWPRWPDPTLHAGYESFYNCQTANVVSYWGALICMPYVREKCLMAPVVTGKTIRLLQPRALEKFSQDYPGIYNIHALRDPRAIQASRASIEAYFRANQTDRLIETCWELVKLHDVFAQSVDNVLEVHYEDLVLDPVPTAHDIYNKMGLAMPSEVIDKLQEAMGEANQTRKTVFDTFQKKPKSRINGWQNTLSIDIIKRVEKEHWCKQFFKLYPNKYSPFSSD